MSIDILRQLHAVIGNALSILDTTFSNAQVTYPSIDDVYAPSSLSEQLTTSPEVVEASNLIVAAAEQLIANVKLPYLSLYDAMMAYHIPSALSFIERKNVVEILAKTGPDGMHVDCVAEETGVESKKLEHVLRLLATHHFFREVTPGVFTNNRLSSLFSSGKSSNEILANPQGKYLGSSGVAALVAVLGDEMFKSAACFPDTDGPSEVSQTEPLPRTAFSRAFQTNKNYFEWLELTENRDRLSRFGHAIMGLSLYEHPEAVQSAYDWADVKHDGLVIDVGGGLGFASLRLAQAFPHLRFVIQDRPKVLWESEQPGCLELGRVKIYSHDFFHAQPIEVSEDAIHITKLPRLYTKDVSVFLVRAVCHDWADQEALIILNHLRAAARSDTILVIGDNIMPYACTDDTPSAALPGAKNRLAPLPLLANLGKATVTTNYVDLMASTLYERSLQELVDLALKARWKIVEVRLTGVSRFGYVIAHPI
ncbi:S-adenosyl-L-methionine-dependent methyltransferase [Hysterangium stoloniferum]|nr:S-adenosyl-L-methionine-dependent methyltransferase [Hysterangium stoloniferum]